MNNILLLFFTTLIFYFYHVGEQIKTQFKENVYEKKNIFNETKFYSPYLLADIKIKSKYEDCPNGYEDDLFRYEYKGTKAGCYCNDQYYRYVEEGYCCSSDSKDKNQYNTKYSDEDNNEVEENETKSRKLSNQKYCPCFGDDIDPVKSKVLKNIRFHKTYPSSTYRTVKGCYLYLNDYTFETKTPQVKQSGDMYCENDNDILCGSNYNAICFPKYFGCPIVRLHFQEDSNKPDFLFDKNDDLEKIGLLYDNFPQSFYIQRMTKYDEDPLTPDSFVISEGNGPCEDKQQNFSNRSKYKLEIQQREECDNIDISYLPVGLEFEEYQFFDYNDYSYHYKLKQLPRWVNFNDNYKFKMYQKGIRGDSIQCRKHQQLYKQFEQKIEKLDEKVSSIVQVVIGLAETLFGLGIFLFVFKTIMMKWKMKEKYEIKKNIFSCLIMDLFINIIMWIIFLSIWPNYDAYYDQVYELDDYKQIVESEQDCPGKIQLQYIFENLEGGIKQNMETSRKVYIWMSVLPIQFLVFLILLGFGLFLLCNIIINLNKKIDYKQVWGKIIYYVTCKKNDNYLKKLEQEKILKQIQEENQKKNLKQQKPNQQEQMHNLDKVKIPNDNYKQQQNLQKGNKYQYNNDQEDYKQAEKKPHEYEFFTEQALIGQQSKFIHEYYKQEDIININNLKNNNNYYNQQQYYWPQQQDYPLYPLQSQYYEEKNEGILNNNQNLNKNQNKNIKNQNDNGNENGKQNSKNKQEQEQDFSLKQLKLQQSKLNSNQGDTVNVNPLIEFPQDQISSENSERKFKITINSNKQSKNKADLQKPYNPFASKQLSEQNEGEIDEKNVNPYLLQNDKSLMLNHNKQKQALQRDVEIKRLESINIDYKEENQTYIKK